MTFTLFSHTYIVSIIFELFEFVDFVNVGIQLQFKLEFLKALFPEPLRDSSLVLSTMTTTVRRTGENKYTAMLVADSIQSTWAKEPRLLHFVEKTGASSIFVVMEAARDQFKQCEKDRIYDMEFSGKVVKMRSGKKYGVSSQYEVVIRFPCKTLQLSQEAWPLKFSYNFTSWDALNQLPEDAFVDLIGKVSKSPVYDANSSLPKLRLHLTNGNYEQPVEILGNNSSLKVRIDDVVSFSGLYVKDFKGIRNLQTAFLTVIEVNPLLSDELKKFITESDEGPVRKAVRMTSRTQMNISQIQQLTKTMLDAANKVPTYQNIPKDRQLFNVVAEVPPFTNAFFVDDPPILETEKRMMMCLKTDVHDSTGSVEVKIWDHACYDLFDVTAPRLREIWEEGHDDEGKRKTILGKFNKLTAKKLELSCEAEVFSYGQSERKVVVQINVNTLELVTE